MNPTRLRECIAYPGWSLHAAARHAGRRSDMIRTMARGRHVIDDPLADWLESIASIWQSVPTDLHPIARVLGCAKGELSLLLSLSEVADLAHFKVLADFHAQLQPPALNLL